MEEDLQLVASLWTKIGKELCVCERQRLAMKNLNDALCRGKKEREGIIASLRQEHVSMQTEKSKFHTMMRDMLQEARDKEETITSLKNDLEQERGDTKTYQMKIQELTDHCHRSNRELRKESQEHKIKLEVLAAKAAAMEQERDQARRQASASNMALQETQRAMKVELDGTKAMHM